MPDPPAGSPAGAAREKPLEVGTRPPKEGWALESQRALIPVIAELVALHVLIAAWFFLGDPRGDLHHLGVATIGLYGQPRLFGMFSFSQLASLLVMLLAVAMVADIVGRLRRFLAVKSGADAATTAPPSRLARLRSAIIATGWSCLVCLILLEGVMQLVPVALPTPACRYLPYQGSDLNVWGPPFIESIPGIILRHVPNSHYTTRIDVGRRGDIEGQGFVRVAPEEMSPSTPIVSERYFGPDGFPLYPGMVHHPVHPVRRSFTLSVSAEAAADGEAPASARAEATATVTVNDDGSVSVTSTDTATETTEGGDGTRATAAAKSHQRGAKLVILGDSFSVGYGLREEDVWPARLLRTAVAADVGMRVFACGGYSPAEGLLAWKRYGDPSEARQVLVQIYEGNDLFDIVDLADLRARDATLTSYANDLAPMLPLTVRATRFTRALYGWIAAPTDDALPPLLRGRRWLARETFTGMSASALANFPRMSFEEIQSAASDVEVFQPGFADPIVLTRPRPASGGQPSQLVFSADPAQFYAAFGAWDAKRRRGLRLLDATFAELSELSREHGFEVSIVYVPTVMNAVRPLLDGNLAMGTMLERALVMAVPQRAGEAHAAIDNWVWESQPVMDSVAALADFHGFRFVNTTAMLRFAAITSFEAPEHGEFPYLPYDSHLSPAGNAAVAEAIIQTLVARPGSGSPPRTDAVDPATGKDD